ncbi:NTP pyrophosphohydrolase [Streptomyces sp. 549]|uniref:NTP pyrophosphohydrolase n=1 Tax=Streptomyces sp. 549 TaxID=3049076 RepID=UPI0024C438A8|nr:NTP pyrophosphohydrolase [Streptomyces sp. 549]MDK1475187.1 NTP pyrophosphohydrolase [Streptomyces sp. 549]
MAAHPAEPVAALPLVVVDAANVVGSVPDGWWRDRHAAAERLRDRLVPYAADGVAALPGPVDLVLVVEGAARAVASVDGVRCVAAPGEGDDTIVAVVAERGRDRPCLVVTADRALRARVAALGAAVTGPSAVRPGGGGKPTGP